MSKELAGALADHMNQKKDSVQGNSGEGKENSGEGQEKLDNNKNNSYNSDEPNKSDQQAGQDTGSEGGNEGDDKYLKMLKETFNNDPKNAVKSYLEAQKGATKAAQRAKELETYKERYDQFNSILENNPSLGDLIKKASQGQSVENLLAGRQESQDKPQSTSESKLENDIDDINESYLIDKGYLNKSDLEEMTEAERQTAVMKATTKAIPKFIAERGLSEYEQKRKAWEQEQEQKAKQQQLKTEATKRYEQSFERAVQMGFDFAGKHADLLDDINQQVVGFRDPSNPSLIREDAFELAAQYVANKKGIQLNTSQQPQQQNQNIDYQQGTRRSVPEGADTKAPPQLDSRGMPNTDYLNYIRQQKNAKKNDYRKTAFKSK